MTKKVMCFGTLDLLHLGHLNYFQQAKQYGDHLIVVLARDKTKEKQHKETIFDEEERLQLIKSLKIVDDAVLGNLEDHYKIIKEKKPDVICLGYDHQIKEDFLQKELTKLGLNLKIVRAKPYKSHKHKSTKIRKKFLNTK